MHMYEGGSILNYTPRVVTRSYKTVCTNTLALSLDTLILTGISNFLADAECS